MRTALLLERLLNKVMRNGMMYPFFGNRMMRDFLEGSDSNLKLSTYIPFISTCSSSPELVTRQLSSKSMVALIPSTNVAERMSLILSEIDAGMESLNAIHGYLLQVLYLLCSTKQQQYDINIEMLRDLLFKLGQMKLPKNHIIGKVYLEIQLEILLTDRIYPLDSSLFQQLIDVRNRFIETFAHPNQYRQLTQSYVQKSFTIFNLLVSSNIELTHPLLSIIPSIISTTSNELIETQLNMKYLLLSQSRQASEISCDFTRYEIELVRFFERNNRNSDEIHQLLPSIKDLFAIIDQPKQFYPFGVIRAYEILSLLISSPDAFEKFPELRRLNINELEGVMTATNEEENVDDVADSMWKYIKAHLIHCPMKPSNITTEQIANIITHLRNITQCYKLSSLRQTATEVFATIIRYFKDTEDSVLLIDFAELTFSLLRDDDTSVRNRTADIVMDLVRENDEGDESRVIPLAAEDNLLEWLDMRFLMIAENDAWSKWLHLLRLIYKPMIDKNEESIQTNGNNAESNLVDVEIFDDTEPNTFDETVYTSYKCFNFMMKYIDRVPLDEKDKILCEFATLKNV